MKLFFTILFTISPLLFLYAEVENKKPQYKITDFILQLENNKTPQKLKVSLCDSLINHFQKEKNSSEVIKYTEKKASTLYEIGRYTLCIDTYDELIDKIKRFAPINQDSIIQAIYLKQIYIAVHCYLIEKGTSLSYQFLKKFPNASYNNKALIYSYLGTLHCYTSHLKTSLTFHQKALKLNKSYKLDTTTIASIYNNYALWFFKQSNLDSTLHYLMQTNINNASNEFNIRFYYNLGSIYLVQKEYESAYIYFMQALDYANKEDELYKNLMIKYSLCVILVETKEPDKCITELEMIIEISKKNEFFMIEQRARLLYARILENKKSYQLALNEYKITRDLQLKLQAIANNENFLLLNTDFLLNDFKLENKYNLQTEQKDSNNIFLFLSLLLNLIILPLIIYSFCKIKKSKKTELINIDTELISKELIKQSIEDTKKSQIISKINSQIQILKNETLSVSEYQIVYQNISKWIKIYNTKDIRYEFLFKFELTNPNFITNIEKKYVLTKSEKQLCAFLSMELKAKEIAEIMYLSPHSIEIFIHRLRKKFGISRDIKIQDFLKDF